MELGQLMAEQPLPGLVGRVELTGREVDVGARGERTRPDLRRDVAVGVDPHPGEVGAERCLHRAAHALVERRATPRRTTDAPRQFAPEFATGGTHLWLIMIVPTVSLDASGTAAMTRRCCADRRYRGSATDP